MATYHRIHSSHRKESTDLKDSDWKKNCIGFCGRRTEKAGARESCLTSTWTGDVHRDDEHKDQSVDEEDASDCRMEAKRKLSSAVAVVVSKQVSTDTALELEPPRRSCGLAVCALEATGSMARLALDFELDIRSLWIFCRPANRSRISSLGQCTSVSRMVAIGCGVWITVVLSLRSV